MAGAKLLLQRDQEEGTTFIDTTGKVVWRSKEYVVPSDQPPLVLASVFQRGSSRHWIPRPSSTVIFQKKAR